MPRCTHSYIYMIMCGVVQAGFHLMSSRERRGSFPPKCLTSSQTTELLPLKFTCYYVVECKCELIKAMWTMWGNSKPTILWSSLIPSPSFFGIGRCREKHFSLYAKKERRILALELPPKENTVNSALYGYYLEKSKHHQKITQEVHEHSSASYSVPQSSHQKTTFFST